MMKRYITIAILCLYSIFAYSQKSTQFIDCKTYQAVNATFTTYVSYEDDRLYPDKDVNITIGKNGSAGLLQISVELKADEKLCDYFHKCGISGDITLELANGNTITCKENKISDFHDGIITAIYTLTAANMELLKKENIEIIRFYMQTFSSKGNYIAANFQHSQCETLDEFTKRKERITITKMHKLVRKLK